MMPRLNSRVRVLVAGLKELWGDEEVGRLLSNPFTAEDIGRAAAKRPLAEIHAALADAHTAGARRWAWMAERLRRPKAAVTPKASVTLNADTKIVKGGNFSGGFDRAR